MTTETSQSTARLQHPVAEKFARHVDPALVKLLGVFGYGRVFVRALGMHMWDAEGREYLDFLAGFGSVNLGHNPPRLIAALGDHLRRDVPNLLHIGPSGLAADLAEALAVRAGGGLEMTLFANAGGEAIEEALKLARAATRRRGFVYCDRGYHGTSFGALAVMGIERVRAPFEPILAGCRTVPFGDLRALERAIASRECAAFVVEPIQGEGGVVVPPRGYLAAALALCRRFGTLLVLDEIQTGLGRTGTLFAFQREGFTPDVLVLGKALGGSLMPVSATLTSRAVFERAYGRMDRSDLHGSTFAGNGMACAAALETLRIVDDEGLAARAEVLGERLRSGLRSKLDGHPLCREVRGRGLLVGLDLGSTGTGWFQKLAPSLVDVLSEKVVGQWIALRMLERGVICQPASQRWSVLKFVPPLTVDEKQIDHVVDCVVEVMTPYADVTRLLRDVANRLGSQYRSGWRM